MEINKVVYGGKVLIDLSGDTVDETSLLAGHTAHTQSGKRIVGTAGVSADDDGFGNVTVTMVGVGGIVVG